MPTGRGCGVHVMLRWIAPGPSEKTHEVVPAMFDLLVRFRRKIFARHPKKAEIA